MFRVVLWIAFHIQAVTCYIGITIFRKTNNSVSYSNLYVNIDAINLPVYQSANPPKNMPLFAKICQKYPPPPPLSMNWNYFQLIIFFYFQKWKIVHILHQHQAIQDVDEFVYSLEQIWRNVTLHYLLACGESSEWVPSEWESKQLIKNITTIHK